MLVRSESEDYVTIFNRRLKKSKVPERNGKKYGFPLAMGCVVKDRCKIAPIEKWNKQHGDYERIIGIAVDEKKRLEAIKKTKNQRSLLAEYGVTEEQAFEIARKAGLLSPFYDLGIKRQGCWFCPNARIKEYAKLEKAYPELWNELRILAKDPELVSKNFRFGQTFEQVDQLVREINGQMTFFDE